MTDDLKTFAAQVIAAARRTPAAGRFGATKAFIHAAWATGRFDMTLGEFKALLVECNRLRYLDLARADLVEAMDPHDVKMSNTRHFGAEFNFIRVPA